MQEQQFPQGDSDENLVAAERAAVRQVRRRRFQAGLAGAGAIALSLFAAGCPGPADNMTPMDAGGASTGGSAGSGGGAAGGANCDADPCVAKAFGPLVCGLCHQSMPAPTGLQSAGLDLQSPNPSTRLKGVLSKHTDLPATKNMGCPTGDFLVDVNNPAESWLWKKINMQQGTCGDPMPQTGTISAADKACMQKYIECMAGKPITAGGGAGGGGAGGAMTGGGGAGGASGGGGAGGAMSGGGGMGGAGGGAGGGGGTGGA